MKFILINNLLFSTLIYIVAVSVTYIDYTCNSTENDICTISNFSIQNSDYRFRSENPVAVHTLQITTSKVPSLSKNLCYYFSDLIKMTAKQISLQFIPSTAFESCLAIQRIDLSQNEIEEILDGTFAGLKHLTGLSLYNNHLKFFDPAIVKGSTSLTLLALVSNHLLEVDEEVILKYLPNLKTIYLNDNELPCDRIQAIKGSFNSKNVTISKTFILEKQRKYEVESMEDMKCMTRGTWTNRLKNVFVESGLKAVVEDESITKFIKKHLNDQNIAMESIKIELTKNFSRFETNTVERMNIMNETITRLTEFYNNTFHLHNIQIADLTSSNNGFLLKINDLERNNAAMQLALQKSQNAIEFHGMIVYGIIGMIIILLLFCLAFASYKYCCMKRHHRQRRRTRGTPPKHQLSLETNVCRL